MNLKTQLEDNPDAIIWDGFNDAIVGFETQGRAVYDVELMKAILMTRDEMNEQDAIEYLEYNVLSAYVGDFTPLHLYPIINE